MTQTPSENTPKRSKTHYALRLDVLEEESAIGWALPPAPRIPRREGRIGDVLGSYRLVELIGGGSMGSVYRAEHVKLGRALALKLLHHQHARRRDAVARLFQEARASSQIRHRNIVDVVDYLEIDPDTVCIVMEYLPGKSLGKLMAIPGAVPTARALDILSQICEGLSAAHAAGIIHRDLKPDNVVVVSPTGERDLVKIVDFGLAKLLDSEDVPLTAAGQVFGTPPYMSPEQAAGVSVDARADIYSLGAIAYEIFTGRPPFSGATFGEYVFKHINVPPDRPASAPGFPLLDPGIESMILRCLDKDPAARYQSARALDCEIRSIRNRLMVGHSRANSLLRPPTRTSRVRPPRLPTGRLTRRVLWSLLVVAAAAVLGAVVGAASRGPAKSRSAGTAASAPTARGAVTSSVVKLTSDPPAHVFHLGHPDPLCMTPCEIAIAPGADRTARAVLVVRRKGYGDKAVAVDVEAPPSQIHLKLERERSRPAAPPLRVGPDRTLNPYRDGVP